MEEGRRKRKRKTVRGKEEMEYLKETRREEEGKKWKGGRGCKDRRKGKSKRGKERKKKGKKGWEELLRRLISLYVYAFHSCISCSYFRSINLFFTLFLSLVYFSTLMS